VELQDDQGPEAMTKTDRILVLLVRILGIGSLFALVPVVMPFSWMMAIHRFLGLGEMPDGPVVEYLARSLSAFYALVGALSLVVASDLDRYRPLIRFLSMAFALIGLILLGIDLAAGMPWWWTALEGPPTVGFATVLYFLACSNPAKSGQTRQP
jgi:hypothetical protein